MAVDLLGWAYAGLLVALWLVLWFPAWSARRAARRAVLDHEADIFSIQKGREP